MSGKLRELKKRIKSVESTKKITYAMEMVSTAKLKRYQMMMQQAKPFLEGIENLLLRLNQSLPTAAHPFFEVREEKKIAVVLITSDSGLCGSYNMDLIQEAGRFLASKKLESKLIGIGKYGIQALKRSGYSFLKESINIKPSHFDELISELGENVSELYLSGAADAVYVVYSKFVTSSRFQITSERILPLTRPDHSLSGTVLQEKTVPNHAVDYIFEPSPELIFQKLVPMYFESKIRQVFLESVVSEQMARMTAMHSATENASELIDNLVLERNKARQASITKELIEIVSGSRAQKIK